MITKTANTVSTKKKKICYSIKCYMKKYLLCLPGEQFLRLFGCLLMFFDLLRRIEPVTHCIYDCENLSVLSQISKVT